MRVYPYFFCDCLKLFNISIIKAERDTLSFAHILSKKRSSALLKRTATTCFRAPSRKSNCLFFGTASDIIKTLPF